MLFNALFPAVGRFVLLAGVTATMVALACVVHVAVERPLAPLLPRTMAPLSAPGRPSAIGL